MNTCVKSASQNVIGRTLPGSMYRCQRQYLMYGQSQHVSYWVLKNPPWSWYLDLNLHLSMSSAAMDTSMHQASERHESINLQCQRIDYLWQFTIECIRFCLATGNIHRGKFLKVYFANVIHSKINKSNFTISLLGQNQRTYMLCHWFFCYSCCWFFNATLHVAA